MDKKGDIQRLLAMARTEPDARKRQNIFRRLDEITGGGVETRTLYGDTRFTPTRTEPRDANER